MVRLLHHSLVDWKFFEVREDILQDIFKIRRPKGVFYGLHGLVKAWLIKRQGIQNGACFPDENP